MRALVVTSVALAGLLAPSAVAAVPAPSRTEGTQVERAGQPKCLKSAKKVASKKLRTPRGAYYGTAIIKVSTEQQGDFSHVVCAYTEVAKRYRKHSNVVRQTFVHLGTSGKLGEIRADTYANKRKPLIFGSSFVPAGNKYVFRVRIEAGRNASGKVSFRVPG
jgi:hypothetical protein